jgi:replicative DNA helicase
VNTATLTAPDSQRAVLGSLLVTNSLVHPVELTPEDFSGTPDRAIYQAILKKWGEGEPFDAGTIASSLNGQLDSVGGPAYLGTLIDGAVPDPGLIRVHVKSIRQFSKLRRLALLAEDLSKEARNPLRRSRPVADDDRRMSLVHCGAIAKRSPPAIQNS